MAWSARKFKRRWRRRAIKQPPERADLFLFESLEPRLLLSADVVGLPVDIQTSTDADEDLGPLPGNDCYVFADGWGMDTVTENDGEGIDTLDFSAVTADLTFVVQADGSIDVTDGTNTVDATGVEWLVGGQGANTYEFEDGASLAGGIDGSAGSDTVTVDVGEREYGFIPGDPATIEVDNPDTPVVDLTAVTSYTGVEEAFVTNVKVTATEIDLIKAGLDELAQLGAELETIEEIGGEPNALLTQLPFAVNKLGEFANSGAVLLGLAEQFGELFDVDADNNGEDDDSSSDAIINAFSSGWQVNPDADLGDIEFPGSSITLAGFVPVDTGELQLQFVFNTSRETVIDLGAAPELLDGIIDADIDLALTTGIAFDFIFGIDSADAFYIELDELTATAGIDALISGGMNIGILAVGVTGGSATLSGTAAVSIVNDLGGSRLSTLELDEVFEDDGTQNVAVDIDLPGSGDVNLTLPYAIETGFAGGLAPPPGTVFLESTDFFSTPLALTLPDEASEFRLVTGNELLGLLDQLADALGGVAASELLNLQIPLLAGATVGDALPFGEAFSEQILNRLVDFDGLILTDGSLTIETDNDGNLPSINLLINDVERSYELPMGTYADIDLFVNELNDEFGELASLGVEAFFEDASSSRVAFRPLEGSGVDTVRLPAAGVAALTNAGLRYGTQIAGFDSAQRLAELLTAAVNDTLDAGDLPLTIEAEYEDGELRFDIAWKYQPVLAAVPLNFDVDLGDIGGVSTDTLLRVVGDLDLAFTFGIEFGSTPELVISPPIFVPTLPTGAENLSGDATFRVEVFEAGDSQFSVDVTVPMEITDPVNGEQLPLDQDVQFALDKALFEIGQNDAVDDRLGFEGPVTFNAVMPGDPDQTISATQPMPADGKVTFPLRVMVIVNNGERQFGSLTEADDSTGNNDADPNVDGRDALADDLEALLATLVGPGNTITVDRDDDLLTLTRSEGTATVEIYFYVPEIVATADEDRISLTAPRVNVPQDNEPDLVIDRRLEITIAGASDEDRYTNPAYDELGLLASPIRFDGVLTRDVEFTLIVNDSEQTVSIAAADTSDNTGVEDLVADIETALIDVNANLLDPNLGLSLDDPNDDGVVIEPRLLAEGGNRIVFAALENSGVTSIEVKVPFVDADGDGTADALEPSVSELGFDPEDSEFVNTTAATLFIERTNGAPMLQGTLTVGADDIRGNASFGFLEVNVRDSFGAITGSVALGLQNPDDAAPRIALPDLIENLGAGRAFFNSPELLGFAAGASAAAGDPLTAGTPLPADGKLERSARFVLQATDGAGEETTRNIKVAASATEDNASVADLVEDVNAALTDAGLGNVTASAPGGLLTFTATDGSALLIPYSLIADPVVTGGVDVDLALQPSVGGVDPVAPAILSLDLNLADWLTAPPDLDDSNAETGLAVNFSGLDIGFYDTLTNLSATDIVDGLQQAVEFLRTLNGEGGDDALLPALDTELPLISVSLADLLDVAEPFAMIVDAVAADPNAGFDEIERLLRDLLGLNSGEDRDGDGVPNNEEVNLGLDMAGDGIVLRVDLEFFTGVDLGRAFDLDLEDLAQLAGGVPELDGVLSFVGVSSSGDLNVNADAKLALKLGVALGADGEADEGQAEGTAAGVEAFGFRDGESADGPDAVITARAEPAAARLTDQGIAFTIQLDDDEPVLITVNPSAETLNNTLVTEATSIGDEPGELSLGEGGLKFTLRDGSGAEPPGPPLIADFSGVASVADVIQRITDVHPDLTAELVNGGLILTDSSPNPDSTGFPSESGNPVFLRGGDGPTASRAPPTMGDPDSEPLDFSLRVGTSSLRFDVHVPAKDYAAGLTDAQLRDLWLEHIEATIKTAMVDAGLLAATDPAAVRVGFNGISGNLSFDANQTLTIWRDISPMGSVLKVEAVNGSLAIFDLGLFGAPVEDIGPNVALTGFELAANVGEAQLIQDINAAIDDAGLTGQVTATDMDGDGRLELRTVGAATPQKLTVQNIEQDESFIRPFLYDGADGTGLFLSTGVAGSNLEFTAQVGPFGFFVIGGEASLGVGLDVFLEDTDGDGRHYFSEGFDSSDVTGDVTGEASASLPLFFPTESTPVGSTPLIIGVDLFKYFQAKDPSAPSLDSPSVTITTPDLTAFPTPTLIGMLSNPEFLVDGLDALLSKVQDALNSEVLSVNLPLVGDQLVDAGQFIGDFRADVLSYISAKLREGGLNPVTIVHEALFNIFGGMNDGDPAAVEVLGFADGAFGVNGQLTADNTPDLDENGRLVGEARFLITIDDDDPVLIVVDPDDADPGLEGLVAAINLSFAARGVGDRIVVEQSSGGVLQFRAIGADPQARIVVERAHAVPLDLFGVRVGALGLLQNAEATNDLVIDIEDVLKTGFGLFDDYGQFDMMLGQSFVFGQSLDFDLGLPALGLALDAEVELFLDWEFDFGFGVDQDVGFYFVTEAHPNAPEGPEDLGPELTITGGAELVGEDTATLFGFENRDSGDDLINSRPLTDDDFSELSARGADLVFRLTLDDGGADEATYFVTLTSTQLSAVSDLDSLIAALNVSIAAAELGGNPADVGVPGVIAVDGGSQRVQLQANDGRSLTIRGDVASAEGRLGFLVVEGVDQGAAGIDLEFTVDLTDPSNDGKLEFSEIVAGSTTFDDLLTATFTGEANLDLGVTVNFALLGLDAALLPGVSLDLLVDWDFANVDTSTGMADFGGTPSVMFENIELDLGSFISDFAGPFLGDLAGVLEPLDFLLDPTDGLLYIRLPVISDLLGQTINIRRLVELFDREDRVSPFLDAVEELYFFVSLITEAAADAGKDRDGDGEADGLVLDFGSLEFPDLRGMSDLSSLNLGSAGGGSGPDTVGRPATEDVNDQIANLPDGGAKNFSSKVTSPGKGSFGFPILTDPTNILNLLIGNAADVDLVTYDLPPFGFEFDYRQRIPIYPPLFATLRGFFGATIDLGFGYDALGLSQFSNTENPLDLINGFFISDIDFATGVDIPELTFTGGIAAGASLDVLVASAGVEGGIDVNIFLNLSDPNMDSKVRLGELESNLILNSFNPLAIFDVSGRLDAFLNAYVEVLLGLWSFEYEVARVTLVNLDLFDFERAPLLGQVSGDELMLNVGANSQSRAHGDLRDTGQTIIGRTEGNVLYLKSSPGGLEQRYDGVAKIIADAGDGNDTIDLRGVNIDVELHGGAGNDVLLGGSGNNMIFGGEGDDRIEGLGGADELHGGEGDDRILGRGGQDELFGDAGNDVLLGGAGEDRLAGGFGDDELYGDDASGAQFTDEYVFGSNWGNDVVIDESWAEAGGGNDVWDFDDVRGDINFLIGAEITDDVAVASAIMTAESLGNSVRQEGFGIGNILGGKGGDFFDVWQTGEAAAAAEETDERKMRLDGRGGSDTYLTRSVEGVTQKATIKDVGNFWDQDRLIFEGSTNPDTVVVTDQEIQRFDPMDPSTVQQSVEYRSDEPDDEDLAAFNALGFTQGEMGAVLTGLADNSGLTRLARVEISVNGEPAELVVVDPDDVRGTQTLQDIADALNVSLEIADLDDRVQARVESRVEEGVENGVERDVLLLAALDAMDELTINAVITGPGLEVMDVFGREGDDTISVESTPDFMAVAVSAGEGDDTVLVGPSLNEIKGGPLTGALVINGDAGFNRLVISDAGDMDPDDSNEGTLTRDRLTGLGIGVAIEFFDIDELSLTLSTDDDLLTVEATNAGSTSIFGNDGGDVVDVLTASGTVNIFGDGGADVLSLDASDADSTVNIGGGDGGDIINTRTAQGSVDILGGAGDDIINVGSEAGRGEPGTLNIINGAVSIAGGDGQDVLNIDDRFDGGDTLPARDALAAITELGRLSGDAGFTVQLDGGDAVEIVVPADLGILSSSASIDSNVAETGVLSENASFVVEIGNEQISVLLKRDLANASLADLETDLAAALDFHGIDADRVAVRIETEGTDSRVVFTSLQGESLSIRIDDGDTAQTELGLIDNEAAEFSNATLADLIDDINEAFADAGLDTRLEAVVVDTDEGCGRLGLNLLDGGSLLINALNDVAMSELGLAEDQFLQPDNTGEHALVNEGGMLRATVMGLGMGADGGGAPGIVYDTVELATISLGTGDDEINVHGTLGGTVTVIDTGAGDDLINVASSAPEVDAERGRLLGTLDDIRGDLDIVAGDGFNTLRISDFSNGQGKTGVLDEFELSGLSPGSISYTATTGFMGGVDLWLGSGDDVLDVQGTRPVDVTSIFFGDGNDQLTAIDASAAADGLLVAFGENGDDRLDAAGWSESVVLLGDAGALNYGDARRTPTTLNNIATILPAQGGDDTLAGGGGADILLGGAGRDTIEGGPGNDFIFGDGAQVDYAEGAVVAAGSIDLFTGASDRLAGGEIGTGAANGGDGNDVLIGGAGNDTLYGTLAEDVLIFEYGKVSLTGGLIDTVQVLGQRPLDLAASTMFDLYNGPLEAAQGLPLPASVAPAVATELPSQQVEVSTGNARDTRILGSSSGTAHSVFESANFSFDSAQLLPESFDELDEFVARLKAVPNLRVEIVGHTDSQGSEEYNLDLSERRARGVGAYLIQQGIDPERITTRGMGESEPLVEGDDDEANSRNRRVEVIISSAEDAIPSAGAAVIGFASWRRRHPANITAGKLVDWDAQPVAIPKSNY